MSRTMLHRIALLGARGAGVGIGAVTKTKVAGAKGYSVIWAGSADVAANRPPVTVPGPGQVGVETLGRRERPAPVVPEDFYGVPRGYPISVSYGPRILTDVKLQLFASSGKKKVAVEGHLFTPESPIHSTRPSNSSTAFFMADQPLKPKTRYSAVFEAKEGERPVQLTWTFTTGN